MGKMRENALIGVIMIVGVLAGAVYVHAVGGQTTLTLSAYEIKIVVHSQALENQAIELALADSRIKTLADVSGAKINATLGMIKISFDSNSTRTGYCTVEWDGKYRALVTIKYPDNTGYGVDVNVTDKLVGEPKRAVWEEGKYFKYLP